jgi:hypothetical protein
MRPRLTALLAPTVVALLAVSAAAQTQPGPELAGEVRGVARTELVNPGVFDPRLDLPLTPAPQIVLDNRGADTTLKGRIGLQWGDNNYAVTVSVPLHRRELTGFRDRREIPLATFGIDLTNIFWRPRAGPSLVRQLGSDGVLHLAGEQPPQAPVSDSTVGRLSRDSQVAVARAMHDRESVSVPWVFIFNGGYKFAKTTYDYTDVGTSRAVSAQHLSDVADVLFGLQFGIGPQNPGTFVAFSYDYSSLFRDSDTRIGPPDRLYGTMMLLDVRRPYLIAQLGINGSATHESDTGLNMVDAEIYWRSSTGSMRNIRNRTLVNAGVRIGYEQQRGGLFAGVFVGPLFRARP